MGCAKTDLELTSEEKACVSEICERSAAIRKAMQTALDSLGLSNYFQVVGFSLITKEDMQARVTERNITEAEFFDHLTCACCTDGTYRCCTSPCSPCS